MSRRFYKILKKLLVWSAAFLAAVIFLGLFAFGIIATVFYESNNNGEMQAWINQTFNASVQFQSAKITWQRFYPTLILNHIQIASSDKNQQAPAIVLSKIEVKLDLIQSIWHLRPVAHAIILEGLRLNVVQGPDKKYYLAGFINRHGGNFSWQRVWPWLREQERIELLQAKLTVTLLDQSKLSFDHVDIGWYHAKSTQYELVSEIDMAGDPSNHLEFKALFSGNLAQADGFSADFYADIKSKDFAALLKNHSIFQLNLLDGGGEIQSWGQWQNAALQRLHSIFNLENIELGNTEQGVKLDYFNENVLWQRQSKGGWQLLMQHYSGANPGTADNDDNHIFISFAPVNQAETWTVECSSVNLEMLSSLIQFWKEAPPRLVQALDQLNPQGELLNTQAEWTTENNQLQSYLFDGYLQGFSINSWGDIPGVSGLSANFHISPSAGTLHLAGNKVVLSPNYWFDQGWPPTALNIDLNWQEKNSNWQVNIPQISLHNDWLDFNGQGKVSLPVKNTADAQVQFLAGFSLSNAQQVMANYVPAHGIPEALSQWLKKSFTELPATQGSWLWKGRLREIPYLRQQGRFQIVVHTQNAALVPWPKWPAISGINADLTFDGPQFTVTSSSQAASLNTQLSHIKLSLGNIGEHNVSKNLVIEGDIKTDGPGLKNYFENSPLVDFVGLELSNIQVNGPLSGHLKMVFPLGKTQHHAQILGDVHFANNQIVLGHAPWVIDNIQGSFSFSPTALHSEGLTATFLGDPLQVTMGSERDEGLTTQFINMQGILNLQVINQLAPSIKFKWWKLISGNTPFNFKVAISSEKLDMVFRSSLKGIAINLPEPFKKANNSDLPLQVEIQGKKGSLNVPVTLSLGNRLAGYLILASNHQTLNFSSGVITIGAKSGSVSPPKNPGLLINGNIDYVSVENWSKALKPLIAETSQNLSLSTASAAKYDWFNAVSLNIANLNLYGQNFNHLNVSLKASQGIWQIGLNGSQIQGFIDLPQNWQQPVYVAHFNRLNLDTGDKTQQSGQPQNSKNSELSAEYLAKLPGLSIVIDQLVLNQQTIGSTVLDMRPIAGGVNINKLDIENQNISALIKGSIISGKGAQDVINLQGNLNGKNWGNALASFGYPGFMQDGSGPISFQLHWLGNVVQPILPTLTGQVSFNLKDGGLSKLNPGLIRLLGLFSLDTLIQHLSLNFSDMTDKGLAFDSIIGSYIIQNSIASTQDFRLTGPSLDLILVGQVNLAQQTLNQTVTVIPHVGGGIALAAGLIGGPVVGAATWVADKVISNTLLKDKGIVYRVTGPWNKPVVTSAS